MTKLNARQDGVIRAIIETNGDSASANATTHTIKSLVYNHKLVNWAKVGEKWTLTDAGKEYARSRGWLAAEAAPVAAAAEGERGTIDENAPIVVGCEVMAKRDALLVECGDMGVVKSVVGGFADVDFGEPTGQIRMLLSWLARWIPDNQQPAAAIPAIQERVLASEVCIGDTLYRRVYGEGVVKAIMHDTLSDRGIPYDIRFTFEDGREMFCDRDYLVFRKPTQTAIPALPDSQFVDAGTHVRVDIEAQRLQQHAYDVIDGKVEWPHGVEAYLKRIQNDGVETWYERDIAKLESELAAARAEIARLNDKLDVTKTDMNMFIGVFNALSKWSRSIPDTDERFETWKYYVHLTNQEYDRLTTLVVNHSSYVDELESDTQS